MVTRYQKRQEKVQKNQVKTRWFDEDGKIIIQRKQDVQLILDANKEQHNNGYKPNTFGRHVGRIPFVVLEQWLKESGKTRITDPEFQEYIKKKLMGGDFTKLLVHGY